MRSYAVVRFVIWLVSKALWRISFEGLENIPRTGSFVMAPIHRSWIDFGYASVTTRRPCLLYTSPSPRDKRQSRMPSSA